MSRQITRRDLRVHYGLWASICAAPLRAGSDKSGASSGREIASRARARLARTGEAGPREAGGATTGRALTPEAPARRRGDPQKAAEQGNAKAQFAVGALYENGDGVKQDNAQALSWYRKAAEQGHDAAKAALPRLSKVQYQ